MLTPSYFYPCPFNGGKREDTGMGFSLVYTVNSSQFILTSCTLILIVTSVVPVKERGNSPTTGLDLQQD